MSKKQISSQKMVLIVIVSLLFIWWFWFFRLPPAHFPVGTKFRVKQEESLKSVSTRLENEGFIRSALLFRAWVSIKGKDKAIHYGGYHFDTAASLGTVVKKFTEGKPDEPLLFIRIPEGSDEDDMVDIIKGALPDITTKEILTAIHDRSAYGFMFPETYYLNPSMKADDIIALTMLTFANSYNRAFGTKISTTTMVQDTFVRDEVSFAAILQGEARGEEAMQMVAGILKKRLKLGMPLQVDVAKETYTKRGLPSIPISSPGLMALDATKHPIESPYLYYITGNDGKMYYAKTFEEHKANIRKHLK